MLKFTSNQWSVAFSRSWTPLGWYDTGVLFSTIMNCMKQLLNCLLEIIFSITNFELVTVFDFDLLTCLLVLNHRAGCQTILVLQLRSRYIKLHWKCYPANHFVIPSITLSSSMQINHRRSYLQFKIVGWGDLATFCCSTSASDHQTLK